MAFQYFVYYFIQTKDFLKKLDLKILLKEQLNYRYYENYFFSLQNWKYLTDINISKKNKEKKTLKRHRNNLPA